MIKRSCFIMGLPGAGKTSFLAALWHSLLTNHSNLITLDKFEGDQSYLSTISKNWANGLTVSRTLKRNFADSTIKLKLRQQNGNVFEVSFPDQSGETFQELYAERIIDNALMEYIQDSNSMLLFINFKEEMYTPDLITAIPRHYRTKDDTIDEKSFTERVLRKDPTQVQLVDLLQFVKYIRSEEPIKLGIIISAWDLIVKDPDFCNKSPKELIKKKLPLLWQFIITNSMFFSTKYFGISAQGGDVEDPTIRDELLGKTDPCDRLIIVDEQKRIYKDITLPLTEIVGE